MFFFRAKQFVLILCCLFVSFSFCIASSSTSTNERSYDIVQVSALPVDTKIIIIDAGHGR